MNRAVPIFGLEHAWQTLTLVRNDFSLAAQSKTPKASQLDTYVCAVTTCQVHLGRVETFV